MLSKAMTTTVRERTQLVVPQSIQRRAGLKPGDRVEFKVFGGIINIIPEVPGADDEYTPAQRRMIDARLAKADDDIRKGRTYGPFNSAGEMIADMKAQLRKRAAARKPKRS